MMRKYPFKILFVAAVFLLIKLAAWAQSTRSFDQELINNFKNNSDFNYSIDPVQYPGFMDILFSMISRIISLLLYPFSGASPGWLQVIAYLVLIAVIMYAIIKALDLDVGKLFFAGSGKSTGLNVSEEELSNVDLENLMREALQKNDYRLAVRYMYLIALQQLAGKDIIHLKPGKTSSDYLHEISNESIYQDFSRLNYYFEYGWYGEFPITPQIFEKADSAYHHFLRQLK